MAYLHDVRESEDLKDITLDFECVLDITLVSTDMLENILTLGSWIYLLNVGWKLMVKLSLLYYHWPLSPTQLQSWYVQYMCNPVH